MASTYRLRLADREYEVEVEEEAGEYRVGLNNDWYPVSLQRIGESARYSLILGNRPYDFFAEESPHGFQIMVGSRTITVTTEAGRRRPGLGGPSTVEAPSEGGEWVLTSPMAGVVQQILVKPDDEVETGAVVMVIEAMKMQNELHARRGGQVKAVYVTVGQRVEQGTPLLVLV